MLVYCGCFSETSVLAIARAFGRLAEPPLQISLGFQLAFNGFNKLENAEILARITSELRQQQSEWPRAGR